MPTTATRNGITLMEVLISMAIATVGVLSLLAILPMGGHLANQGTQADRLGEVGQQAFRDFRVRGFASPASWIAANQNLLFDATTGQLIPQPLCIDPQFVAANNAYGTFPYGTTAVPTPAWGMNRISIRQAPGSAQFMPLAQAGQAFVFHDDLVIDQKHNDGTGLTQQKDFLGVNYWHGAGQRTKRFAEGRFSWMAMLTPESPAVNMYTLYAIIYFNRDAQFTPNNTATTNLGLSERSINVTLNSGGFGGGDATLGDTANPAVNLNFATGDWIMLARAQQGTIPGQWKWYRIVNVDEWDENVTPVVNTRNVTLAGPDWTGPAPDRAVIAAGVVGVFEKTIKLETSSLWLQ